MDDYQHWQLEKDLNQILWLTLNRHETSVNSLDEGVLNELDQILNAIIAEPPSGVIILSGKSKGFIAGADIKQFIKIKSEDEAFRVVREAQKIFDKLANLTIPTVAMIHGFCLGGGLELALACRYRIAEKDSSILGLPEVNLGLHPGWGGTVRLPRLIGALQALPFMVRGQPVSASKAKKMGLIDAAVPYYHLRRAALDFILHTPPLRHLKFLDQLINFAWIRSLVGKWFLRQLNQKISEKFYPAPFAIVDHWIRDGAKGETAMIHEARSIAKLMVGSTSRELIRVFFLQEQLKSLGKNSTSRPQHIHVVGAGAMGGDIAAWCAYKGFKTTLQDKDPRALARALQRAFELFSRKLEQKHLIQDACDRLQPDLKGLGVRQADLVIEAVFEDLKAKEEVFHSILGQIKPNTWVASNTSSILLEDMTQALARPALLIGLHFFNPVSKMLLVEIVNNDSTPAETLSLAASFINQISHLPLPVKSSPGFLVNRILMPYLLEAFILIEEGVSIQVIDQSAKDFGMPMGPVSLADKVGLDICLAVAENLAKCYGFVIPGILRKNVQEGHLGVKSGQGFYHYNQKGVFTKAKSILPLAEVTDRLILRLCNEAVACLAEKIVANADSLDVGVIFGMGFPAFRGGLIQYIRHSGVNLLREKLDNFTIIYGERFRPHPYWEILL